MLPHIPRLYTILATLVLAVVLLVTGFVIGWRMRAGDLDARIAAVRARAALEAVQRRHRVAAAVDATRAAAASQEAWDAAADRALAEQIIAVSRGTSTGPCHIEAADLDAMNKVIVGAVR